MPGIAGSYRFFPSKDSASTLSVQLNSMCRQADYFVDDYVDKDGKFVAGRVHLGILDSNKQPASSPDGHYVLFMDGEFYNRDELRQEFLKKLPNSSKPILTDAFIALQLYLNAGWEWLKVVDGLFSLALYDRENHRVFLITDRHGLRPLYIYQTSGEVIFGSEVKAVLADSRVPKNIDLIAVKEFFTFGYLLEDRTWIEDIRLLPPASVTTISVEGVSERIYWSWDEIKPLPPTITFEEAKEELGRLWIQAVHRRADDKSNGILLSGGLDSRAVLAAIPDEKRPVHAVTFGIPGCDDRWLATRAAAVKSSVHHLIDITEKNWLNGRFGAVWWTDGHLNMLHMHVVITNQVIKDNFQVNLHSFAGDLILGGSYLKEGFLKKKPKDVLSSIYQMMRLCKVFMATEEMKRHLSGILAKYMFTDQFFLNNRVRRFTLNGPLITETVALDRKPTFDNDLFNFCYSLPDSFRYDSRIYRGMLLNYFPAYFRSIPWQKTGLPISKHNLLAKKGCFIRRVVNKATRTVTFVTGISLQKQRSATDYNYWTRVSPARQQIDDILLAPGARWPAYLSKDKGLKLVRDHMSGGILCAETLLALLTFEIYLRDLNREGFRVC